MTKIEWTDRTWNPLAGCTVHSAGCTNCYAMRMAARLEAMDAGGAKGLDHYRGTTRQTKAGAVWTGQVNLSETALLKPLGWKKPRRIFVNSMSDLFHEAVPDRTIDRVFAMMALCPHHIFQVLTKRADRMREYLSNPCSPEGIANIVLGCEPHHWGVTGDQRLAALGNRASEDQPSFVPMPLPNAWLGVSVEDQRAADERIPDLLATPAAVRFISAEPLLGPVDLRWIAQPDEERDGVIDALSGCDWIDGFGRGEPFSPVRPGHEGRQMYRHIFPGYPKLDWVIAGGESGPGARGSVAEVETWMRALRDQCAAAGTPFFAKQGFQKHPLPDDLQMKEFPR